jgi:hypothetical protein
MHARALTVALLGALAFAAGCGDSGSSFDEMPRT